MAKLTDVLGRPHSGLVPWVVPALVVDNVDPDELGRIKVKFPTLFDHGSSDMPLSFWLRQVSPNAGKERGLYALPEKEDEVLVVFMHGSQDVGVIIGQFWNGKDKPPTEAKDGLPTSSKTETKAGWATHTFTDGSTDLGKNDRRFWRSRSGHLFVFDDTDGSENVQIWDKGHNLCLAFDSANELITLSSSKDIEIRAGNDIIIEADNDFKWKAANEFHSESGKDSIHKVGMNYEFEATMDAKHKAGMNYQIEATMNLEGKGLDTKLEGSVGFEAKGGATAKLEGGAMTTVKGGMVMIN